MTTTVTGPLVVDDTSLAIQGALAGLGIALAYEDQVAGYIDEGKLIRVLEDWSPSFPGFFILLSGPSSSVGGAFGSGTRPPRNLTLRGNAGRIFIARPLRAHVLVIHSRRHDQCRSNASIPMICRFRRYTARSSSRREASGYSSRASSPKTFNGKLVGHGDFAAQARLAFGNLGRALAAAGARPEQVCKITIYIVDYKRDEHVPIIEAAQIALFGDHKPANVVVGIAMMSPGYLIEVDAIAIIDGTAGSGT